MLGTKEVNSAMQVQTLMYELMTNWGYQIHVLYKSEEATYS